MKNLFFNANHCKSLSFLLILYSYQSLAQGGYVCYTEELGASPAPQAQATLLYQDKLVIVK